MQLERQRIHSEQGGKQAISRRFCQVSEAGIIDLSSLISREKKGVTEKIGSYVTDIQKFKIETREAAKDILYRVGVARSHECE